MKKLLSGLSVAFISALGFAQCDYTLQMLDSFGDGWNGNTVDVLVNGTVVLDDVTFANGFDSTLAFQVNSNDQITTIWNGGGQYGDETSYEILDSNGIAVGTAAEADISTAITATCPSCVVPTNLTLSSVSSDAADLQWDAPATAPANGYEYYYSTTSTAPDASTTASGTASSTAATLTGLTPSSTYYAWVRSVCSATDQSIWTSSMMFNTACVATTAPFYENFENAGAIPNCWENDGAEDWEFSDVGSGNHIGDNGTIVGNSESDGYFAYVDASGNQADAVLLSPFIDVSTLTSPYLSFYILSDNEGNASSRLDVEVWDGAAWNNVGNNEGDTNGWSIKGIDLSSITFSGDARIKFIFTEPNSSDFYDDIAIDDVRLDEAPSCLLPTNASSTLNGNTAATITWDAPSSAPSNGYDIYYMSGTVTPPTSTTTPLVSGITATTYDVSNLNYSSTYTFWVRSNCGSGAASTWVSASSLTTPCGTSVPNYEEDFASGLGTCWTEGTGSDLVNGPSSMGASYWIADGFLNNGSTGAFKVNLYSNNKEEWLISPEFDLSGGGNYEMNFSYAITDWGNQDASNFGSDDQVVVLMSEDNGVTWTTIHVLDASSGVTNSANYYNYPITSTSSSVKFAFYATDGSVDDAEDIDFFIDKFTILDTTLGTTEVDVRELDGVQLYPNPFHDIVNISNVKGVDRILVVDMAGRVIKSFAPTKELNLGGLNSGMYLINLSYEDGSVKTLKAIKK